MKAWLTLLSTSAVSIGLAAVHPGCAGDDCLESFSSAGGDAAAVCTSTLAQGSREGVCYARPQICPSLQPVLFNSRLVNTETGFNLLLQNFGRQPLTITGIRVRGDERCAFVEPQTSPAIGQTVEGADGMILRFKYRPPAEGEDHIQIEVESDAENFPLLSVSVCGRGVTSTTTDEARQPLPCLDRTEAEATSCWDDSLP